jgi:hypothetical protein
LSCSARVRILNSESSVGGLYDLASLYSRYSVCLGYSHYSVASNRYVSPLPTGVQLQDLRHWTRRGFPASDSVRRRYHKIDLCVLSVLLLEVEGVVLLRRHHAGKQ